MIEYTNFVNAWNAVQFNAAGTNIKSWGPYAVEQDSNDIRSRKLLQIVGEVVEAQDALRIGNPPSEKIPAFTSEEEELADVILRTMDYAFANKLRIAEAILAKAEYNKTREYRHGGKLF